MSEARSALVQIYFSDFFEVSQDALKAYAAFNISLVNDLPLFIDPFLLFNSQKPEYRHLHDEMIRYLRFLRDKAAAGILDESLIGAWCMFPEVRQTWLGFSKSGNQGSGLGWDFALALSRNLNTVFNNFGQETITKGSHLEKLTLIQGGVGRDNISDFVTTLIKRYLLQYTETFARTHLRSDQRASRSVPRASFNYETETWQSETFELPIRDNDYVILTPKDMLTKDETWINRPELVRDFEDIAESLPNAALRALVNNYFQQRLPRDATARERVTAKIQTLQAYPEVIERYIRKKEDDGDSAQPVSSLKVRQAEQLFINEVRGLVATLLSTTSFYSIPGNTYEEAVERVKFLKDVIENKDGYRIFWRDGQPIQKEEDLQILYRLTWYGTPSDVNREVNNGRGPADFAVSRGAADKSLVECKLASNTKLKQNLQHQSAIYERASDAARSLKVILYFTAEELDKVRAILKELGMENDSAIILIDARRDNKPSASVATTS
jgi:hypothetical protein